MAKETTAEKAKKAQKALDDYLKANKLDPKKDHSKDKKHGKKVKELSLAAEKLADLLASEQEGADSKKSSKKAADKGKEKKGSVGRSTKYDYPPGLSAEEKKAFRVEARKKAKGDSPKKSGGKAEKTTTKEKKAAPAKAEAKSSKKKAKKSGKKNHD